MLYAELLVATHVLYTAPLPWVCELSLLLELLNNKDSLMALGTCPITPAVLTHCWKIWGEITRGGSSKYIGSAQITFI